MTSPRATRTQWQQQRDEALARAGKTKKDVWLALVAKFGKRRAPSVSGVRAALDNRYRDIDVQWAFVQLIAPNADADKLGPLVELYFPVDEPLHRTGGRQTKTNAA